jgi:hypothetical protein
VAAISHTRVLGPTRSSSPECALAWSFARVLIVGLAVSHASNDLVSLGNANRFVASRLSGQRGCYEASRTGTSEARQALILPSREKSRHAVSSSGFLLRPSVNAADGAAVTQGDHHDHRESGGARGE